MASPISGGEVPPTTTKKKRLINGINSVWWEHGSGALSKVHASQVRIARDINETGVKCYTGLDAVDILPELYGKRERYYHYYEVCGDVRKLYFDIEKEFPRDQSKQAFREAHDVLNLIIERALWVFDQWKLPVNPDRDILLYTSSGVSGDKLKESYHLIFNVCFFPNYHSVGHTAAYIAQGLERKENEGWVDLGVYDLNRPFRLLRSTKFGKTRVKRRVYGFLYKGRPLEHQIEAESEEHYDQIEMLESLISVQALRELPVILDPWAGLTFSKVQKKERAVSEKVDISNEEIESLLKTHDWLSSQYKLGDNGDLIRINSGHCPGCKRTHDRRGAGILKKKNGEIYFLCYCEGTHPVTLTPGKEPVIEIQLTQNTETTASKAGTLLWKAIQMPENGTVCDFLAESYKDDLVAFSGKGPYYLFNSQTRLWDEITRDILSANIRQFSLMALNGARDQVNKIQDTKQREDNLTLIGHLFLKLNKTQFLDQTSKLLVNSLSSYKRDFTFDKTSNYLPVKGGFIVDLKTGEKLPRTREHYFTRELPVEYTPEKGYARITKLVSEMMLEDKSEKKPLTEGLQRLFGYASRGDPDQKVLGVLIGDGDNGKSLLVDGLVELFVMFSKLADRSAFMAKDKVTSGPQPFLHALRFCRYAFLMEAGKTFKLDENAVKSFTGGDKCVSRDVYETPVQWKPGFVPFLVTNFEPNCSDDKALLRRIYLYRFKAKFCENPTEPHERKMDTKLTKIWQDPKWLGELLNWIVAGSAAFEKEGLNPPPEVLSETQNFRLNQDPFETFLRDDIEVTGREEDWIMNTDLYQYYKTKCESDGKIPLGEVHFGRRILKVKGVGDARGKTGRKKTGIRFKGEGVEL